MSKQEARIAAHGRRTLLDAWRLREPARRAPNPPTTTPYRVPALPPADKARPSVDPIVGGLAILLIASLVRLFPSLTGREPFGTEPTLALLAAAFSGYEVLKAACLGCRDRLRGRSRPGAE
jgi:hypothetical protein